MTKSIRFRPIETLLAGLLVALPVVLFAVVWNYYAVDIPKWDDHALRDFLYRAGQEPSLSGKLYYLLRQHNEHRIVYDRIVTALDYGLFGKLNYRHLMVAGNLSLVGLLVLFGAVLRRSVPDRWWLLYLAPVALMLFNLSQWENMFWGMAALQNFTVVLWVGWAIYLLADSEGRLARLYGAMAVAILATLTSGNGMLVWPIGFGILLLQSRWGRLKRWASCAVSVLILYFIGYEKPAGNPPDRGSVVDLLKGWLAFNGSAGEVWPTGSGFQNSVLLGSLLTVVALVALFSAGWPLLVRLTGFARPAAPAREAEATPEKIAPRSVRLVPQSPQNTYAPAATDRLATWSMVSQTGKTAVPPQAESVSPATYFFIGSVVFLLGTGALVAWARVGFGLDTLITSRYKLYSLTLLAVVYVYLIGALPRRTMRWAGWLGGAGGLALAWLSYYSFLDETIWWRHYLLTKQFNWTYTTNRPVAATDSISTRYGEPAAAFYDAILPRLYGPAQQPARPISVAESPAAFTVRDSAATRTDLRDGQSFVVARSYGPQGRVYLFPTWPSIRAARQSRLRPWTTFGTGFWATLPRNELAAGTYALLVLSAMPTGGWSLRPTNQTIYSVGQPAEDFRKNW